MDKRSIELKTKRMTLLPTLPERAKEHLEFHKRNRDHFRKWGPQYPFGFFTLEFWQKALKNYHNSETSIRFHMFYESKIIGEISLNNVVRGIFNSANLGYKIDYEHEGLGLMTEALKEVIRFSFNEYGLHRLEASHIPDNFKSARVLKKMGFQRIGLAKKYLCINGRYVDHIMTQLIKEDFE